MIYTDDVKKELDAILKAFENYIDGQDYFDIVYSKKIGYFGSLPMNPERQVRSSLTRRKPCWTTCLMTSSTILLPLVQLPTSMNPAS